MIRPRGGDFVYSDKEIGLMKEEILFCKTMNISGVVFGVLKKDNTVDLKMTRILSEASSNLEVTFHKAIDQVDSIYNELDKLKSIHAISSVLTSGGAKSAIKGKGRLKELVDRYAEFFTIIPAGKITHKNIDQIHELIGAREYHGRNIVDNLNLN